MKRDNGKTIDLGKATRETKGGGAQSRDTLGKNPFAGLSND